MDDRTPAPIEPDAERPVEVGVYDVVKRFGDAVAVDHVTLEVRRGEFFSLLGPSGCGKTTTLRLIAGFEDADAGRIMLSDADIDGVPPYRRNVNTVFQSYALFPHLSVWDNVAFGLRRKKRPKATVREQVKRYLELVELEGMEQRRPGQLSGGQQQRVALARALVNEPAVLLLDEPLGALDLKLRKQMQLELMRIQREVGITFVYVTHDQEEALVMSDRLVVMRDGRIEQIGYPEDVYERPATRFVAGFIGTSNIFDARVRDRVGDMFVLEAPATDRLLVPVVDGLAVGTGDTVAVTVRPERSRWSTTVRPSANTSVRWEARSLRSSTRACPRSTSSAPTVATPSWRSTRTASACAMRVFPAAAPASSGIPSTMSSLPETRRNHHPTHPGTRS